MSQNPAIRDLNQLFEDAATASNSIQEDRKVLLKELSQAIHDKSTEGEAKLCFICTHNSRRSQIAQVLASFFAHRFELENLSSFSAGTEVTAFHPNAIAALQRAGFDIQFSGVKNPLCRVSYSDDIDELQCFSKRYDDTSIPVEGLLAVMVCSDAEKNCPYIPGVAHRMALPYSDPKEADDSPQAGLRYDATVREIAAEMYFLFETFQAEQG